MFQFLALFLQYFALIQLISRKLKNGSVYLFSNASINSFEMWVRIDTAVQFL